MVHHSVVPVILCGGLGSRLWPLSTPAKPKPFHRFVGPCSLLQNTLLRCRGPLFDPRPIIVASLMHQGYLTEQLSEIGVEADVLLETVARDSLAAALAGAFRARERGDEQLMLMLAADHHIPDGAEFAAAVERGCAAAKVGSLVSFGVTPDRPLECYGYIQPGEPVEGGEAWSIAQFVEKPPVDAAAAMIAEGWLWNSGNVLCKPEVLLQEARKFGAATIEAVQVAYDRRQATVGAVELDGTALSNIPPLSIDRAIMEKTRRGCVLPVAYKWSDVGTWATVAELLEDGTSGVGHATVLNATGVFVHSLDIPVAVVGVDDVIVVATDEAVLVTRRNAAQQVGRLPDVVKASVLPNSSVRLHHVAVGAADIDLGIADAERFLLVREGLAGVQLGSERVTMARHEAQLIPVGLGCVVGNIGRVDLHLVDVTVAGFDILLHG